MTKQSNGNNASEDEAPAQVSHWLIVAATLIVATLALIPTFSLLWDKWSAGDYTQSYSHGVLILPLVAWLVFRQRHNIARIEQRPFKLAFIVLAGLLFGWTWAFAANIAIGAEALWPLILICSVLAVSGWRAAMSIVVPVLLLYSAIPVWDVINPLLQSLTTMAVALILQVIGVPAFIQGNFVQVPAGTFEIAGGCSGIHFLIVAMTLAAFYGHLYHRATADAVVLLAIAAAMSIMMNWIRVATIIVAGHLTDMQSYLVKVDHYTFGWVLFAVMLIPFFFIARRLERGSSDGPATECLSRYRTSGRVAPAGVALLLLALPVLVWGRLVSNGAADIAIELPDIRAWQRTAAPSGWQPRFPDPDGEAQATYVRDGQRLDVYANWYKTQSQERELIGYYTALGGDNAHMFHDKPVARMDAESTTKSLEIHEIMADYPTGERRLIWYHFLIGGESRSRSIEAQLRLGLLAMVGAAQSGAIAVSAICDDRECEDARALLADEFATFNTALAGVLMATTEH